MAAMEQSSYQQRRDSFTRSLHHFHETRGTGFKRVPEFAGKEVDLFKLYNVVTDRGGWLKVNRTNGWDDLVPEFNLPADCTNGGNALKQIYLRFLDRYEKVHFLGENGDRNDEEEDVESRHRRWSARSMHTVSLTYNYHQHNVSETARRISGLSTDLYRSSEYDRLALSLVSPLPNEQDFAINVCTLLSNEGKYSLRLDKCPRLLEYLLAHAGVYNHSNLRILFEEIYGRVRGHLLSSFWSDVLESPELGDLTDENKFQTKRNRLTQIAGPSPNRQPPNPDPPPDPEGPICLPSEPTAAVSSPTKDTPDPLLIENSEEKPETTGPSSPCASNSEPATEKPSSPGPVSETPMDVDAPLEDNTPKETPEEMAERLKREEEEQERIRKETEEKLKKELAEAEHYEALRRSDEARRCPKNSFRYREEAHGSDITVVGERKNRPEHLGLNLSIEDGDCDLFNLGRDSGTGNFVGQRILQVANILRNLSFCEEVVPIMARNTTFLRFLLLCANSRWNNLHQLGLDMLGNVAPELTLEDPTLERIIQVLFGTVSRGIRNSDRFIVLSSLEVLNKVCQRDENEEIVSRNVDQMVYEQICRLLSLHDIMVLLYTLECLYSMSSMGEKACNHICRSQGAIQMLLSLITVEAQSYGPKACILMRVIETVSGGAGPPPLPPTFTVNPSTPIVTPTVVATPQKLTPQLMRAPSPKAVLGMPMGAVATPVPVPNASPTLSTVTTTITVQSSVPTVSAVTSVQQQHAHQQTVQENEQFAQAWVRANYELSAGGKVEQHEMYKKYVDSCSKLERKGVITSMHFPRIVRSVFGGTVGPKPQAPATTGTPVSSFYDGIQVREVPLTINVKLVPMTEVHPTPISSRRRSSVSPILKAQLVSAPSPLPVQVAPAVSTTPSNVPDSYPNSDMDNTSLIKSLLASKVTQRQAQAKLLQAQQQQPLTNLPTVQAVTSSAKGPPMQTKIGRINGIIQDTFVETNHVVLTGKGKKEPPQPPTLTKIRPDSEDSESMTSSSRDFPNTTGIQSSTDDNENSLTSFEGIFLNGIDLEAALSDTSKLINNISKPPETETATKPKSQMLADLLDKKESPLLNGLIGEKGLELVEKAILADKPLVINNNGVVDSCDGRTSGAVVSDSAGGTEAMKRPPEATLKSDEPDAKRPRTESSTDAVEKTENGEEIKTILKELNGDEEVRASSKAANLFAALAAEALEDEEVEEDGKGSGECKTPATTSQAEVRPVILGDHPPLLVTAGGGAGRQIIMTPSQGGQVLISTGGQLTLQKPSGSTAAGGTQSMPVMLQNQRIVSGQQYIVSGNTASPMLLTPGTNVIQGQTQTVLLTQTSQQQGTSAKTIIILQPQPSAPGQPQQHQKLVLTSQGGNVMVGRPMSESPPGLVAQRDVPEVSITQNGGQLHVVRAGPATTSTTSSNTTTNTNGCQQIQVISSGVQNNAPILADKSGPALSDQSVYLCEWRSCMKSFKAASEVYLHVCSNHCPVDPEIEAQCLWGRCDGMKRKRFSLMTHLYDRHCNADVLNMMAMRRRQLNTSGRTEIPAPAPTPPHPGYAPNAAFHAIKRHAGEFTNPKELMRTVVKPTAPLTPPSSATVLAKAAVTPVPAKDDNEGPVTKSIRLTASLILRNLIIYSSLGRRFLKGYEPHLANIALSNVESSRTIAQVLADMNDASTSTR